MATALQLAERGLFTTDPNPRVGCVIADSGSIVGRGWHERAGGPHAEIVALRDAGRSVGGLTAYVTIEEKEFTGTVDHVSATAEADRWGNKSNRAVVRFSGQGSIDWHNIVLKATLKVHATKWLFVDNMG